MAEYRVRFLASAAKEFRDLPSGVKQRVADAVDELAETPRRPGARKLIGQPRLYRIRVGSYRIIYEIDDDLSQITIKRIRHRREAYR